MLETAIFGISEAGSAGLSRRLGRKSWILCAARGHEVSAFVAPGSTVRGIQQQM
jgi:hypothetical protein